MSASQYLIEGGRPLQGVVSVGGAKNAISKQLVASLLTREPCVFTNVPRITEIETTLQMLEEIGTRFEWTQPHTLVVQTPEIRSTTVSVKHSRANRIPILLMAPLLHRAGEVTVPVVGGCRIGPRPVDYHLAALENMGAVIEVGDLSYTGRAQKLMGRMIRLPYPSVGATENIVVAATLAAGTTVISNGAVEPEITDTILMLQKMGARIQVDVDRRIIIEGVKELNGTSHHTITDRIEAASFAAAAIATHGKILVRHAQQEHLITFLNEVYKIGGGFTVCPDGITFFRKHDDLTPTHIETDVHPGFATDWQQPFVVVLTQARGASVIHETVYEDRFGYSRTLNDMGANTALARACLGSKPCRFKDLNHSHSCIINGPTPLRGARIEIPDLRAGFAYLIAALVARGCSEIGGIHFIERGYAGVAQKLEAVGAAIRVE